jgi:hypothetical protein
VRPAFICEDGKHVELNSWNIPETTGAQAVIRLENVSGAKIGNVDVKGSAESFVRVEANDKPVVDLHDNKIPGIKNKIDYQKPVNVSPVN